MVEWENGEWWIGRVGGEKGGVYPFPSALRMFYFCICFACLCWWQWWWWWCSSPIAPCRIVFVVDAFTRGYRCWICLGIGIWSRDLSFGVVRGGRLGFWLGFLFSVFGDLGGGVDTF